jgi:hypothetical protein
MRCRGARQSQHCPSVHGRSRMGPCPPPCKAPPTSAPASESASSRMRRCAARARLRPTRQGLTRVGSYSRITALALCKSRRARRPARDAESDRCSVEFACAPRRACHTVGCRPSSNHVFSHSRMTNSSGWALRTDTTAMGKEPCGMGQSTLGRVGPAHWSEQATYNQVLLKWLSQPVQECSSPIRAP